MICSRTIYFGANESLRSRGIHLQVKTSPDLKRITENALIVGTKEQYHFLVGKIPGEPTVEDLLQELSGNGSLRMSREDTGI